MILGRGQKRLAFRQGKFVPVPAAQAGIRAGDIIIGIDDRPLEMTMLEFNVYVRLNHQVGDRITYNVLRNGKRLDLPMKLADRPAF
jgi:S1-C subfamily serine protease